MDELCSSGDFWVFLFSPFFWISSFFIFLFWSFVFPSSLFRLDKILCFLLLSRRYPQTMTHFLQIYTHGIGRLADKIYSLLTLNYYLLTSDRTYWHGNLDTLLTHLIPK